jgi:hypothetical protein
MKIVVILIIVIVSAPLATDMKISNKSTAICGPPIIGRAMQATKPEWSEWPI